MFQSRSSGFLFFYLGTDDHRDDWLPDVPHLVSRARVPGGVELINLGAWNDDPWVIRAIKAKIDAVSGTNVC